jgi:hypothetical protein
MWQKLLQWLGMVPSVHQQEMAMSLESFSSADSHDPYWIWSNNGGAIDFEAQDQYLVAYECDLGQSTQDSSGPVSPLNENQELKGYPISVHPIWWSGQYLYGTATVNTAGIAVLERMVKAGFILRFEVGLMPKQMRSWRGFKQPAISKGVEPIPIADREILYGVIDHGLPFLHPGLKCQNGSSRLLSAWYQEEDTSPKNSTVFAGFADKVPQGFGFGRTVSTKNISSLIGASSTEDWRTYAAMELPELRRDYSHGAHMLGNLLEAQASPSLQWASFTRSQTVNANPSLQLPKTPDTVFVQLPHAYVESLNRCAIGAYRLSAMRYILESAGGQNSTCKKVVIPISSEDYVGSHDGTSLFEMAVDALVKFADSQREKELQIYFAAGNSLRARVHDLDLNKKPNSNQKSGIHKLRIAPQNELATFIEIWFQGSDTEIKLDIQAFAPVLDAKISSLLKIGQMAFYADANGHKLLAALRLKTQNQQMLLIRIAPSFSLDNATPILPSANWKIEIKDTKTGQAIATDAYIARSFAGVGGALRSYQSRFLQDHKTEGNKPDDLLNDLPRYGHGSINGMANGENIKVVGGYQLWSSHAGTQRARYSSAGPGRTGSRITGTAVDALAPSDESPYLRGIRHWGNRSGNSFRLSGTSVATPFVARAIARSHIPQLPERPQNSGIDNPIANDKIPLIIDPLIQSS